MASRSYPWVTVLMEKEPTLDINTFIADVETCSDVSGYDFNASTMVTSAQASRTCKDPSCSRVENVLLGRAIATKESNGAELRNVFKQFARPMLEFCWYYRQPGAACPNYPPQQIKIDFCDMLNDCETRIGGSFTANVESPPDSIMCNDPSCQGFARRDWATRFLVCAGTNAIHGELYMEDCELNWTNYEYLPGPVPDVIPDPTPPTRTSSPEAPINTPVPTQSRQTNTAPTPSRQSTSMTPTQIQQTAQSPGGLIPIPTAVGVTIGLVVVIIFGVFLVKWRRKRTRSTLHNNGKSPTRTPHSDFFAIESSSTEDTASQRINLPHTWPSVAVSQLTEVGLIAAGASGLVFLVQHQPTGRMLAAKQLAKRQVTDVTIDAFIQEITIAASLKHPHIVEFIGVAGISRHQLQVLFEYMEGGDLRRYLDATPWQPWTRTKVQMALDVAKALAYIHSYTTTSVVEDGSTDSAGMTTSSAGASSSIGIVHRDLKSRNIMLTSDLRAKIGDFGVSRAVSTQATMTAGVGTSRWLAPEVILGNDGVYDASCDMYSFGVVLTELDSHKLPYYDMVTATGEELPEITILSRVAEGTLVPSLLPTCLGGVRALASRCLAYEAKERPTASEAVDALMGILDSEDLAGVKAVSSV